MAKDPYKYFRIEAREILEALAQGALELEKGGPSQKDVVGRLFRYAHTLKGAARVVKQPALADAAHAIEDVLTPHREAGTAVSRASIDQILRLIDTMMAGVSALGAPDQVVATTKPPTQDSAQLSKANPATVALTTAAVAALAEEPLETVRIEIGEMDALLDDVFQASAHIVGLAAGEEGVNQARQVAFALADQLSGRRSLRGAAGSMERARAIAEELAAKLEQVDRRLAQGRDQAENAIRLVRERAHRLRLLPASTLFPALERATRDAAKVCNAQVEFVANGGDNRLDGHVLLAVRDALLHVVRNAVTHGIESPDERATRGKPAAGRVTVHVEQRGHHVVFVCVDDGRGIDVEAVRRVAVTRGLVGAAEAQALSPHSAMQLVFLPGVSTSTAVTDLSGRGVGLDVVRETARRFKGDAEIQSEQGRSTSIEVKVPISLSSLSALLVEVGGAVHALPLDAASGALRVRSEDIVRAAEIESIVHGGQAIPFSPMARILGVRETNGMPRTAWSVIVLRAGGRVAAIGVDRLLGTTELVIKPIPVLAGSVPLVMGASIDADGNPLLVLDVGALVEAACTAHRESVVARPRRPPILVIDDSLTTRMLEQSILESAGYEVDIATSAEEALEKAALRKYGLFVCDVEMPGMDGYGFVTYTRADPVFKQVPVIMVTSLNSPAHRQRGLDAGASEFMVKGEFDQGRLLQHIRTLIG